MTDLAAILAADGLAAGVQFSGPTALAHRGLPIPSASGVYVVVSGPAVSHIGMSGNLRSRVSGLAALRTHRATGKVLCVAHCTQEAPFVWWCTTPRPEAAVLEAHLKSTFGAPPTPGEFAGCANGKKLLGDLVKAAGADSWEAGYVEAVFAVGEKFHLLFAERFRPMWDLVGVPPGPWRAYA